MDTDLIKEAAESLSLVDIYLLDFSFEPHKEYHPSIIWDGDATTTQEKKEIKCKKAFIYDEVDEKELLLIEALLGIRVSEKKDIGDEDLEPIYTIEAKFRAEYIIKNPEASQESLKEFSRHNGLHAIWPFWRQFVYDMMPRLRLPIPEVPLRLPLSK
jgi:hypothetical protein